jgi:hypothetical protein
MRQVVDDDVGNDAFLLEEPFALGRQRACLAPNVSACPAHLAVR